MLTFHLDLLSEVEPYSPIPSVCPSHLPQQWQPPTTGTIKLNFAVICEHAFSVGCDGVLARDWTGSVVSACTSKLDLGLILG